MAGDQQSALFWQQCTAPGMVKNTYGTGCFIRMNTGTKAVASENRLLTTVAWQIGDETHYALEGSIFMGGATVHGCGTDSADCEFRTSRARRLRGPCGWVVIVPAIAGLGTPHWNGNARGAVFGLTRGSTQAHLARAVLDSIAHQTVDVMRAMEADAGVPIAQLRVDGGATVNDLLMQYQSDILGCEVVRPEVTETTALGAAYLAGLAVGYWTDLDAIAAQWSAERTFTHPRKAVARRPMPAGTAPCQATLAWADDR